MNLEEIDCLKENLPQSYRLRWIPADLEGPAETIANHPDYYCFEVTLKKRFLGIFQRWHSFAYIQRYWPADADNVIYFTDSQHLPILKQTLSAAKLSGKVTLIPNTP